MKRLLLGFCLILTYQFAVAQPYGNEWIDYDLGRYYLKFKVQENGIYRIDKSSLEFALNNLSPSQSISSIDPRSIQVFAKGEEQTIYVQGESDGTFDNGDYIELFCEKNDGWLDERLYPNASQHTNPHYSIASDTLTYFLTWNPNGASSSKRYVNVPYTGAAVSTIPYLLIESKQPFNNLYNEGEDIGQGKPTTLYTGGKGWVSNRFGYNNSGNGSGQAKTFSTSNATAIGGTPNLKIEVGVAGYNRGALTGNAHHVRLRYKQGNGNFIEFDDVFLDSYEYRQHSVLLPPSFASNGDLTVQCYTSPTGASNETTSDYNVAAYISLTYPHSTNFTGESLDFLSFLAPASSNENHVNLSNWTNGSADAAYDAITGRRYEISNSGNSLRFNVASGVEREIVLSSNINSIAANKLLPVGENGQFTNPSSLERDSAFIIVSNKKIKSSSELYRGYRNSTHPGQVSLIYIDELYDQFAYGVPFHPISIRGFCEYAYDQWATPPQHLLLLGKAIEESDHRISASARTQLMVPTMGNPPSDYYFTMGFGDNPYAPSIATGRIAAKTNAEVNAYREKLRLAELAQNDIANEYTINKKQWQKHALHFAGGSNSSENKTFINNLNNYANTLEQSKFAGKAFLFSKTTGTVIEQLDLDTVRDLIRDGVSIMTFFGHGTTNGFDVNVDNPSSWDNAGRYPVVMANSCFSGNIHLATGIEPGISEQYVLIPNLGAIAFVATPGLSIPSDLNNYTGQLYMQLASDKYGQSLGQQMLQTAKSTVPFVANDEFEKRRISMALEMTLHGDPAYKINPHSKSEFTINDPDRGVDLRFEPATITTDLDSFDVIVNVSNLGHTSNRPVNIAATRIYPTSANDEVQYKTIEDLGYSEEIRFRFAVDSDNGIGENELTIEVDLPNDSIDEFVDITNNEISSFNFDIIDGDISPVYPYNFGVVSNFDVTLRANTGYPFAPSQEYVIQIDTTDTYDSPFFQQIGEQLVTQSGAIIEWNPGLLTYGFSNEQVFFWRVSPSDDRTKWREFSFQVLDNKFGWGQSHFFQYKANQFDFINYNRNPRKFSFEEASRDLQCQVLPNPNLANQQENSLTEFRLDGQLAPLGDNNLAPGGPPSMAIVVIDTIDLKPWGTFGLENGVFKNQDHQFGNSNNYSTATSRTRRVEYFFSFTIKNNQSMDNMIDMINNEVPEGYYILAYTLNNAQFKDTNYWKEAHFATFEALGADSIRHVENKHPYIFLSKKGSPNLAEEVLGYDESTLIRLKTKVFSSVKQGSVTTPDLGPAMKWQDFLSETTGLEANAGDDINAQAIGKTRDGIESIEAELTSNGSASLANVDADSTLEMKMRLETFDNTNGTPAQLASWHLIADPAPDVAVNPILGTALRSKKVAAGEPFHWGVALQNISEFDFGRTKVAYWVTQKGGKVVQTDTLYYDQIVARKVIFDSIEINTTRLNGRYTLWIQANPYDNDWHKELYAFNNRAYRSVTIEADNSNPLLDVTFDGIHILNGDIVSPEPEIVMELKDENPYLLMQDTTAFDVYITYPSGAQRRIPFQSSGKQIMEFEPATSKKNKARLIYRPDPLEDGTHTLSVMGRDASGNSSGTDAYKIDFEVINRSTITQVMNYPNPFTTSTQFVFTLTGSRVPDVFTIQIVSVTGKVVKEITKNELGNIHIGRNITDYRWNGTDHFGDRLANGVYLYRVIMKIDGEDIERRASGADEYFTKEFGKMYLFR